VLVKPGERIAVDGEVIEGESHVDESLITGESLPIAKRMGEHVTGGAMNGEGMLLVKDNLVKAVKKPTDLDARGNMLVASTMGATAFQRGLGAIHALSHPFGGLYDAHHGMLNGIVMPYVLKANRKKIEKDIERAAAYLGIKGGFNGFLKWVLALRKEIGIPHKLADIGIDTKRLDEVAKMAVKDPSAGGNPIQFSEKQYKALAKKCVVGDL